MYDPAVRDNTGILSVSDAAVAFVRWIARPPPEIVVASQRTAR
jgi:hypothetical protein